MINSVHMKFFRQHKDLEVNFDLGLNVLRGPNEGGKTTIIEAFTYAFWGAKALRDTLAETVTWGEKESALWVKTICTFAGTVYTVTRSKAGAEVNYAKDGEARKVVGQNEVTSFMSDLLGVDANAGAALILATQSDLRGTLEAGPTAASGLMAKLADFDLIDRLVVSAQGNLVLGAEKPVREKLVAAQEAEAAIVVPTETKADFYDALRANAQHQLDTEREKEPALAAAVDTAFQALQAAERNNERHAQAEREVQRINQHVESLFTSLKAAQAVVDRRPAPGVATAAIKAMVDAGSAAQIQAAYDTVRRLPAYPESFWEGTKEGFDLELASMRAKVAKADSDGVAAHNAKRREAHRLMKGDGKCPTCGAENVSKDHIDKHNAEIQVEIDKHEAAYQAAVKVVANTKADISAMEAVQKVAQPFELAAKALSNQGFPIKIEEDVYPPKITWTGGVPATVDVKALQAEVDRLNKLHKDADVAEGQVKTLTEQIAKGQKDLEQALMAVSQNQPVDLTPLEEARMKIVEDHRAQLTVIGTLMTDVQNYTKLRDDCIHEQQELQDRKTAAIELVAALRRELDELIFNNGLVAKLRNLKPKITDDLWNKVLSAVSSFFSTLRGDASVVTKGPKGFKVNDRSIDSLSGSTLDVLAIAIRVAMTKTFIPQATFIVLDEPAHGCDVARTGKVLGFLGSVGFDQVILASHDELSEAVADRVVALGD